MEVLAVEMPKELVEKLKNKAKEYKRTLNCEINYLVSQALLLRRHIGECEIDLMDALLIARHHDHEECGYKQDMEGK